MPEPPQTVRLVDIRDEPERTRMLDARSRSTRNGLHLHLALDKFNGCQDDRSEGAARRSTADQRAEGELVLIRRSVGKFAVEFLGNGVLQTGSAGTRRASRRSSVNVH